MSVTESVIVPEPVGWVELIRAFTPVFAGYGETHHGTRRAYIRLVGFARTQAILQAKNYNLISPRLTLTPSSTSIFRVRPCAVISTTYLPEPSSSLSNLKSP